MIQPWVQRQLGVLGALGAGVALAFSYPPWGHSWLLLPSLLVIIALPWWLNHTRPTRLWWWAACYGLLAGAGFSFTLIGWLRVIGMDAWLVLSLAMSTGWLLQYLLWVQILRQKYWPIGLALVWGAHEWIIARWPLEGFGWGSLAMAQVDLPGRRWLALLGSTWLAIITVFFVASLWWAITRWWKLRSLHSIRTPVAALAIVIVGTLLAPLLTNLLTPMPAPEETEVGTVAIVQGNVPALGMDFLGDPLTVLQNNIDQTKDLEQAITAGQTPTPQVVIWPENSSDYNPMAHPQVDELISTTVDALGIPVLVGAIMSLPSHPDELYNMSALWQPVQGFVPLDEHWYAKQHLVPFGEYVPFRDILGDAVARLTRVGQDKIAGTRPGLIHVNGLSLGIAICFEVIDPPILRDSVQQGAQLLVVQTNNAVYGLTGQPEQQFAFTRLRAIENHRTAVVASTSGISGMISPEGEILNVIEEDTAGWRNAELPLFTQQTPFTKWGPFFEAALLLGALGLALVAAWSAVIGRSSRDQLKDPKVK